MKVGILGGGQLGRMLALAGYPLGLSFRVFEPVRDAPAGRLAEQTVGSYDAAEALHKFSQGLAVVTYEFENVPVAAVRALETCVPVYPPSAALAVAQDRLSEKTLFRSLGIPTPEFEAVESRDDLRAAAQRIGLPAVLKTRRLGYDGKGQFVMREAVEIDEAWNALGGVPLILEGFVPFQRELSLIAVRGRDDAHAYYPLVENHHRDGILRVSKAPAPGVSAAVQAQADRYARAILDATSYVGVLALELFERDGVLMANEIAPRVHNSGHWTIEGAKVSQFENHLRAILGLPLGSTDVTGHSVMLNLIGTTPPRESLLARSGVHVHLYDKTPAPGRKLGHITAVADTPARRDEWLRELQSMFE